MTDDELKKFAFCDGDLECPCGPCSLLRDCHEVRAEIRGLSEDYKELSRLRKAEAVDNLATQNRLTRLLDALEQIATDMITPECPANEVDDCETCQSFIQWGRKLQALIKEARGDG